MKLGVGDAMLITHENILLRFTENLVWATGIDLATAWATSNGGLRALQDRNVSFEVRSVVGLWGTTTTPGALGTLAGMGELRVADESRRFHPKVYVFRGEGRSVAWIGSANFTSRGFGGNEEALFETADTEAVESWFDRLWEQCGPLDECTINNYAEKWAESRKENHSRCPSRSPVTVDSTPMQLLEKVDDWRSYVKAIEQCDQWWSERPPSSSLYRRLSVLGERDSWSETIQELHNVVKREEWIELSDCERAMLLGLTEKTGAWALLGGMRPPAWKTVFGGDRENIQETVLRVVHANDSEFPSVAIKAYKELTSLEGVGPGIATRLLVLARPGRFVSLNKASAVGLAQHFGLKSANLQTLEKPENYERLLEAIYDQTWFREPAPEGASEQTICWMRAALLDCFVYDKQLPG